MVDIVVPHDPVWKEALAVEAAAIQAALGDVPIALHHIGSTAIAGILAKPIIDLLGTVPDLTPLDAKNAEFEALGYEVMGAFGIEGRRYFRKVNTAGTRTHHLHIFKENSHQISRHLAFRDYLVAHPDKARAYSDLKARLISADGATWAGYLDGKDPFIRATEQDALRWYHAQ